MQQWRCCWKEQKAIPNFSFDSLLTLYTREHSKILNLLNEENNSKFVIKWCNIDKNQSNLSYDAGNDICSNTEWLKSNQQRKHHSNHRKHRFELLSELTQ